MKGIEGKTIMMFRDQGLGVAVHEFDKMYGFRRGTYFDLEDHEVGKNVPIRPGRYVVKSENLITPTALVSLMFADGYDGMCIYYLLDRVSGL